MTEITGGPNGIGSIPKPTLFGLTFERRAPEGMQTFHEFFGIATTPTTRSSCSTWWPCCWCCWPCS